MIEHFATGLRELKLANSGPVGSFSGWGATFSNKDLGGDVIEHGAFTEAVAKAETGNWPSMYYQHRGLYGEQPPIGVWTKIEETASGLRVEGQLADTPLARDVYALMKMEPRPAISGLSIGYVAKAYDIDKDKKGTVRRIKSVDLLEISVVERPMNTRAKVTQVKSIADMTKRELEQRLMRDAGFSASEAKALLASGYEGIARDADLDEAAVAALEKLRDCIRA